VTALQHLLAAKGFSPGAADGDFGPNTATAVRSFQSSRKLTVRHR
jgi:peptidoglycan hydrolase-like protein with peptidoglycan-binding domain